MRVMKDVDSVYDAGDQHRDADCLHDGWQTGTNDKAADHTEGRFGDDELRGQGDRQVARGDVPRPYASDGG